MNAIVVTKTSPRSQLPSYTYQDNVRLARIINGGRLSEAAKIYSEHLLNHTHSFNAAIKSKASLLMTIPQFQQKYYDNLVQYCYQQQKKLKDDFIQHPVSLNDSFIDYCLFLLQDAPFQGLHVTLLDQYYFYIDDHFITIDEQYSLSYNIYIRDFFHSILKVKAWSIIVCTNVKRNIDNKPYFFDDYSQLKSDLHTITVKCLGLLKINSQGFEIIT